MKKKKKIVRGKKRKEKEDSFLVIIAGAQAEDALTHFKHFKYAANKQKNSNQNKQAKKYKNT